jgi:hypothetical protein
MDRSVNNGTTVADLVTLKVEKLFLNLSHALIPTSKYFEKAQQKKQ